MAADSAFSSPHALTVRTGNEPYACQQRVFCEYQCVQDGWDTEGGRRMIWISFRMSTSCRQFELWDTDPRCAGCKQEKDVEYAARMSQMK